MKKRKITAPAKILPAENRESFSEVIDKVAPLVKMWQDGEVKKIAMETEVEKQFFIQDYRFKRFIILVLGIGTVLVLALCAYLFITNKDSIAANFLTITLTGVISFIGGFGLGKSTSSAGGE